MCKAETTTGKSVTFISATPLYALQLLSIVYKGKVATLVILEMPFLVSSFAKTVNQVTSGDCFNMCIKTQWRFECHMRSRFFIMCVIYTSVSNMLQITDVYTWKICYEYYTSHELSVLVY